MLKKIRNVLWLVFFLAIVFLGAWIAVDNSQQVDFIFFGILFSRQALGMLVVGSFVAGVLLGVLGNALLMSWMLIRLKRLQKRLQKQENKNNPPGKGV